MPTKLSLDDPIHVGIGLDMISADYDRRVRSFGFDGAEESTRRKQPAAQIRSDDEELADQKRKRLQANAIDIARNFAIAAWAIRKHLDFVTSFSFSSNNATEVITEDADEVAIAEQRVRSQLDDDIAGIINEASTPSQCDVAGRHDLDSMFRIGESRATITGDQGYIELADGTMQAIEGDRVRTPSGEKNAVHGVRVNERGAALAYAVHARNGSGYKFERWIPAANMMWRGYYDRFDQVRGISPMAPALNTLRDVYEGFDFALGKAKLAQLFGFKLVRNAESSLNQEDDADADRPNYIVNPSKGPWFLDLQRGDDASIMTADVPGNSFQAYSELMIAISLLALDLPWNFFKVDATNFFGSRAALNLYLKSVRPKRLANLSLRNRWTKRQLQFAVLRGKLRLPRSLTIDDLRYSWTADGTPWWNPSQEADGAQKKISMGLDNPQDICLETGNNFFRNVDRIAEAMAYAKLRKVPLSFAPTPTINIGTQS